MKYELEERVEVSFEQYRTKDIDYVVSPYSEDNGTKKLMFNNEYDAEEEYFRFYKQGFLAGLHEGQPKWHDLREDKNDLPKEDGYYLVKLDINENCNYEIDSFYLDDCFVLYGKYVIAWCEIPTFDKE